MSINPSEEPLNEKPDNPENERLHRLFITVSSFTGMPLIANPLNLGRVKQENTFSRVLFFSFLQFIFMFEEGS
jgi:hypothetical protein